jgi:hypothetical protein
MDVDADRIPFAIDVRPPTLLCMEQARNQLVSVHNIQQIHAEYVTMRIWLSLSTQSVYDTFGKDLFPGHIPPRDENGVSSETVKKFIGEHNISFDSRDFCKAAVNLKSGPDNLSAGDYLTMMKVAIFKIEISERSADEKLAMLKSYIHLFSHIAPKDSTPGRDYVNLGVQEDGLPGLIDLSWCLMKLSL